MRLTARTENGCAYLVNVKPDEQEVDSPYKNTLQCILDCFERLAAYEDIGSVEDFQNSLIHADCMEAKAICYEAELDKYKQADAEGRLVVLPKDSHQPVFVKMDAVNTFDKWNDTTGAIPNGTSWYYEAEAVVEEIAAMAFGAGIFYEAERHAEAALAAEKESSHE